MNAAAQIDALLPQTQCGQCGYRGCAPYAEAIAAGTAAINRCPPGGAATISALAALTGQPILPLDPACGSEAPWTVARIEEAQCIGCTLCIQACPVDAIIGAARQMHTVAAALCTGCRLCLPPCPVDCIVLLPAPSAWDRMRAAAARERYQHREARRSTGRAAHAAAAPVDPALAKRDRLIAEAVARARARRGSRT